MKTAIVFGVTGQDGSYLTDLLISKNYKVVGVPDRDWETVGLLDHLRI